MGRKKLEHFAENLNNPHILEVSKPIYTQIKGQWQELQFKNSNPITLELACGRGEYSIGLGKIFAERNFIGIDIKGSRLWTGASIALAHPLPNVAFLRTYIQNLDDFFAPQEVNEIWISFPDPRPRGRDEKRRLTHPRFLEMYQRIIQPDGLVHLKTDNQDLFEFTLEVLSQYPIKDLQHTFDLDLSPLKAFHYNIETRYEKIFKPEVQQIKYLQFRFDT